MKFFPKQWWGIIWGTYDDDDYALTYDSPEVARERREAKKKRKLYLETATQYDKQADDHRATIEELKKQIEFLENNSAKLRQMADNMTSVISVEKFQGPLDEVRSGSTS